MRILRIGDPHVKHSNVDECEKLMQFIVGTIVEKRPDRVELLGDLFHTHAILRLEVLEFWDKWLNKLSDISDLFVIVGNHDQTGDYSKKFNALSVFNRIENSRLHIISHAMSDGFFGYMPYYHDSDKFLEMANKMANHGAKVLICHQTFTGSKYESGIYAPDGIDANLLKYDLIISGHIHSRQRFGNVIYPGTTYWQSNSDVNQPKGLWLVDHDKIDGHIISEEFIDTSTVCKPIIGLIWKEGEKTPEIPENARVSMQLVGSSDWVSKNKKLLKGQVSISTKITDKANKEARKSGGNFHEFISNLFLTEMDRPALLKYAKEMGLE